MRHIWLRRSSAALAVILALSSAAARAQPEPQPVDPPAAADDAAKKEVARSHFEKGLALYEKSSWDAALAEFVASRAALPTRSATKNAALCLRNLSRFDEAVDMFETLLQGFPDLSQEDRVFAERALAELRGLVGAIDVRGAEAGATLVLDGRTVATFPLKGPVRASAGTRSIRVYKEGFFPFDARAVVAGGQTVVVEARLAPLTRSGRLKITEQGGRVVTVLLDGVAVGKTPWEGVVAPGDHVLSLRGDGREGTQPVSTSVRDGQTTPIALLVEELPAALRVEPRPANATVTIDGVPVGRGTWEGRLRSGSHSVEVSSDGFVPRTHPVQLEEGEHELVSSELTRVVVTGPAGSPSRFAIEVDGIMALSSSFGGVVSQDCDASCERSLGAGGGVVGHGAYELGSGVGFGLSAGYLSVTQSRTGRPAEVRPAGRVNQGLVDDDVTIRGLLVGVTGGLHVGKRFPGLFRLGAGALIGSVSDARKGTFENQNTDTRYVAEVPDRQSATFLYVAPEARVGWRFAERFEASLGVAVLVLAGLSEPTWDNEVDFPAGDDGAARFDGAEPLVGDVVVLIAPGVGIRWDF